MYYVLIVAVVEKSSLSRKTGQPFNAGRCTVCRFPRLVTFQRNRFVQDLRACIVTAKRRVVFMELEGFRRAAMQSMGSLYI